MNMLAIDPGASGGFALISNGGVACYQMPETQGDTVELLVSIKASNTELQCVMEKTGGYMPGNSGPAACKFARGCGFLEGVIMALCIPLVEVSPATWMKALGSLPKEKKERKNAIKALMQQRYPCLKITLKTSDALGILTWAIMQRCRA
jgi:hypothetical protein